MDEERARDVIAEGQRVALGDLVCCSCGMAIAPRDGMMAYLGTDEGPLCEQCWGPVEREFANQHGYAAQRMKLSKQQAQWVSTSKKRRRRAH